MKKSVDRQKIIHNRKRFILICLLFIFLLPLTTSFGRYTLNNIKEFFNRSREFYFYSDKLGTDTPLFLIDNWSGVDDYTIIVNMNSRENNILGAKYDINYNISYTCSNNAICTLNKTAGVIPANKNTDSFNLIVTPNAKLDTGDEVRVVITATADAMYEKTITGEFVLRVGKEDITYKIEDSENSPYLNINITNTKSFYVVDEAFDSYKEKDSITIDQYLALSDENKNKCHSAVISIRFNPLLTVMDMTNPNYLNATQVSNTTLNGYQYINGITFKMDAISSTTVRLYKTDVSQNYTDSTSIISFSSK